MVGPSKYHQTPLETEQVSSLKTQQRFLWKLNECYNWKRNKCYHRKRRVKMCVYEMKNDGSDTVSVTQTRLHLMSETLLTCKLAHCYGRN